MMNTITMRKWMMVGSCVALLLAVSTTSASALQFWKKKDTQSTNDAGSEKSPSNKGGELFVFNDVFDLFDPLYHTSLWDFHHASNLFDPFAHHYRHHSLGQLARHPVSDWYLDEFAFPTSNKANAMMSSYNSLFHTDLVEKENEYRLQVDLPGIDTKDLSISVEENKRKGHSILTITAERKKEEVTEEEIQKLPGEAKPAIEEGKECNKEGEKTCTTTGEKKSESEGEKKPTDDQAKKTNKWIKQERLYGKMERQLILPENVNTEAVKSQYVNGVLTITLPKIPAAAAQPLKRQIAIEAL